MLTLAIFVKQCKQENQCADIFYLQHSSTITQYQRIISIKHKQLLNILKGYYFYRKENNKEKCIKYKNVFVNKKYNHEYPLRSLLFSCVFSTSPLTAYNRK